MINTHYYLWLWLPQPTNIRPQTSFPTKGHKVLCRLGGAQWVFGLCQILCGLFFYVFFFEEEEGPIAVTYVEEDIAVYHEGGLVGHVNKTSR